MTETDDILRRFIGRGAAAQAAVDKLVRLRAVLTCNACGHVASKGPWCDDRAMAAYHLGLATAENLAKMRAHMRAAGHRFIISIEAEEESGGQKHTPAEAPEGRAARGSRGGCSKRP